MKKFDKYLKILWFINGAIIFILLCVAGYLSLNDLLRSDYNYPNNDLIVGDKLEDATKKGLKLQGLSYSEPKPITDSGLSFMTVSVDTYQRPQVLSSLLDTPVEYGMELNLRYGDYSYNDLNVIFIDKDYTVLRTLLDKKANINSLVIQRPDSSVSQQANDQKRHIAYEIAFEDTNEDGFLNNGDLNDLYLSKLTGENLTQITKGIDVMDFRFIQGMQQLFITYYERNDKEQEHKRKKFAIYDINTRQLRPLTGLSNTIDELENKLRQ